MDDLSPVAFDTPRAGEAFELFARAPVASWHDLTGGKPILIIAPHADDETLGCGGLIVETVDKGGTVVVAVMTDGTRSHPNSPSYDAARLTALREAEVVAALQTLGVVTPLVSFLRRADGYLADEGEEAEQNIAAIKAIVDRHGIGSIFVTWGDDPHPDHAASYRLACKVVETRPQLKFFAYPIWGLTLDRDEPVVTPFRSAMRYEVRLAKAQKRRAIDCFASQLGRVILDDPEAFSLSAEDLDRFCGDFELFIDLKQTGEHHRQSISSVPTEHFDNLYRRNADPWNYVENRYEQDRFSATIDALPQARYLRACEIGCSIGVLTERLAERCDSILGVDCSALAMAQAQARLAPLGNASARLMRVPAEVPEGCFDLIVLSEVLYFFSDDDLRAIERFVTSRLEIGGTCILVNFLGDTESPRSGAEAADMFIAASNPGLRSIDQRMFDGFRIDVLERVH